MTTQLYRYPLDITGVNPDNRVVGEIHELPNRTVRALAPLYGAFYTESVVIRDTSNGLVLTKGTQWRATEMFEFPTGRYGKEICGIILITDPTVSNTVELEYQVLGGEYGTNLDAVLQMLNVYTEDRPVAWPDLIGKPDAFTPAAHYHDAGDIYGFEYVVNALERLRQAVLLGDVASHDEILKYIDRQDDGLRTLLGQYQQSLNDHISNQANPHATTKAQVGLGAVQNYGMATNAEALAGLVGAAYMSPVTTKYAIDGLAVAPLNTHIARTDNPHSVTKAQIGLGSVDNYATATQAEAVAGVATNRFMTPLRTKEAIDAIAGAALLAHTSRTDNPHSVTKSQVGLGSVENYAVATLAEAQAGTSNIKYMTPLRTKDAIDALVGQSLTNHISRTDNPHSVTKAQVGLGSVENYGIATQAEALAGTSNVKYMTPLLVDDVLNSHESGGSHDSRYVRLNAAVSTSLRESGGQLHAYIAGAWRVVWPPQWQ